MKAGLGNAAHLLLNPLLLVWIGRLVEQRTNLANAAATYGLSVLASAAAILFLAPVARAQKNGHAI
jgi:hypothetical protein